MPEGKFEFRLPRMFGKIPAKDVALILTNTDPKTILRSLDSLQQNGRNFYNPLKDVYFANADIIKRHLEFFQQNGIELLPDWETNINYKNKLSEFVIENRCFLIDTTQESLYRVAKKDVDYYIVNPHSIKLDLKPISKR